MTKKVIIIGVLAVLAIAGLSCTATKDRVSVAGLTMAPFHTSLADVTAAAADGDRNILIDFYTDW